MKWVTWKDVGVDRMACAWLIRGFIDPKAEFIFVAPGGKPLPGGAEPFDIPGVRLSHKRGHCTFHTMLSAYGIENPALRRIAQIVDEADVVQEVAVEPAAPGLDLICRGLRKTSRNDLDAIKMGGKIFDGLRTLLELDNPE